MSAVKHLLSSRGLSKRYRGKQVVHAVDLDVYSGECVGLLGPNGAGKTTSFYMVCGLVPADGGEVSLDGESITGLPMHLRARRGIGYLPQEASIFRKLTVRENLLAVFETLDVPDIQVEEELEGLLVELGIEGVQHQKAYTLSGGQRRRTEIARALVTKPRFLLLDEPFAGVDPIAVEDIQAIIADLRSRGIGILITDHNVRDTLSICDRAYLMNAGEILVHGTPEEITQHPDARRLYFGERFNM
ncbi:MAG TPA: LPS export ABC transporter ATP-binding protein [Mariprofundaceae bacterium]|nr:LPS export ABC transporter ATP-binding protein [Mariprofundaceae bacterium]